MASICFTDNFFNGIAESLYGHGSFGPFCIPQINPIANGVLAALGLPKGLVQVELCQVPAVSITAKSGFSVVIVAKAQSLEAAAQDKPVLVMCELHVKVDFECNRVILVSKTIKCDIKPTTVSGKILRRVVSHVLEKQLKKHLKKLIAGLIPDEIDITEGKIEYDDGSVVVSGDLNVTTLINNILKEFAGKCSMKKS